MALTIGCDPEFLVVDSTGSTRDFSVSHADVHGNVGSDHGSRVGELRPTPGTPAEVTEHIKSQILWIKRQLRPGEKIVCGGGRPSDGRWNRDSIGGHIHFGGVPLSLSYDSFSRTHWSGRSRCGRSRLAPSSNDNKLVMALDYFIGKRLQKVPGGKRPNGASYGKMSDIETKNHHGGGFEYRTPPSWLTDPYLTESVLAVSKRIVEMWQLKPTVFDYIFAEGHKKSVARRRDYDILIPTENGRERRYFIEQLRHFRRATFSKTYKMDDLRCVDYWETPSLLQQLYEPHVPVGTTGAATTRTLRGSRKIELQICQIKTIDRSSDFETETVTGVCYFAIPEVKIYPFQEYTPWTFQLTRDIRLRPDTIYFSKEMRPFLKIRRGGDFRCRFVDIRQRRPEANGTATVMPLTNCVFYNGNSKPAIAARIVEIFNTCARKKLRNSDAADDSSDEADE